MSEAALDIRLVPEENVRDVQISVGKNTKRVTIGIEKSTTPYEKYEGPYEVVPQLYYGTVLETADKVAKRNITVSEIPVQSVSNPAGGQTVTIG